MNKLNEIIKTWLALINILFIVSTGLFYFNSEYASNRVQDEQIKFINQRLDDLSLKINGMDEKIKSIMEVVYGLRAKQ